MVARGTQRVLALADGHLSLGEAAKVDALAGWTFALATADRIDALIRIRPFVQAQQQR